MTTGITMKEKAEGENREKKMLDELTKRLNVGQVTDALKASRD